MADEIRTCAELDEHLAPFVDGEEPPAARTAVEAHLAKCPPCKKHATDEAAAREIVHSHRDALRVTAPDAFRQAVWLRDVEELTYAEMAKVLDVPMGTVMSRISRGRRALSEGLQARRTMPAAMGIRKHG